MNKLNNKGFTLVELLAVIIILAIVVGISIPSITNIINDSKNNALGVAVDAAEDYLADQYSFMNIDYTTATTAFSALFPGATTQTLTWDGGNKEALLKEMGFSKDNVVQVTASIDANGKACVKVDQIKNTTSEYYSTTYWNAPSSNISTPKTSGANIADYKSRSCS